MALHFDELLGDLREFNGRVLALEIRDGQKDLIAQAEGEFSQLESSESGRWSFRLGVPPHPHFIAASWLHVYLDARHVTEIHEVSRQASRPRVGLRIRLLDGTTITLWPAPLE